jgi:hypothetical protein
LGVAFDWLTPPRAGRGAGLRLAEWTVAAAVAVFCAVQDRETSAGVGRYVSAQRAALAGRGPAVTVDAVMLPAIRASVRGGLAWGGIVGAVGLSSAAIITRRSRRG